MTAPWVFRPSYTQNASGDDVIDDALTFSKNWTYNNDGPGDDGLPSASDSVDLGNGAAYESSGSLTVGDVTGELLGGTIETNSIDGLLGVGLGGLGGMLSIAQDVTLGSDDQLDVYSGVADVQGTLTINPGRLSLYGGSVNVSGDLNLADISGYTRGVLLMEGGTLTVKGTANFGEHSNISSQLLILTHPDDDLAVLEGGNLVFGSQSVSSSNSGATVYTPITKESATVAGELIADNTLTIANGSYVQAADSTPLGSITGAGVQVGGALIDSGGLSAEGAGVFVKIGGSAQLLGGSLEAGGAGAFVTIGQSAQMQGGTLSVSSGAALEVGGAGGLIPNEVVIDAGARVSGSGLIQASPAGTTNVGGYTIPTYDNVVDNGAIEAQGGTLTIDGALSGSGQVIVDPNSNLVLSGAVSEGVTITFSPGDDETITIADPEDFKGVISSKNLTPGDKIYLPYVPYVDPGSADNNPDGASFNFETGQDQPNYVLQVVEDDKTYDIPISQDDQFGGGFQLSDENGRTLVTYTDDDVTGYSTTATADGAPNQSHAGIVQLLSFANGGHIASGFAVADDLILTAAHFTNDIGGITAPVYVVSPSGRVVQGYVIKEGATHVFLKQFFAQRGTSGVGDWAYIWVPRGTFNSKQIFTTNPLTSGNSSVIVSGYPSKINGVKVNGYAGGPLLTNQYSDIAQVSVGPAFLQYVADSKGQIFEPPAGESGGPVWTSNGSGAGNAVGLVETGGYALRTSQVPTPKQIQAQVDSGTIFKDPPSDLARITSAIVVETGDVDTGQTVQFLLNMSENVTVTGAGPTLTLNNGAVATYNASNSSGTELEFDYVVGAADKTSDLEITTVTGTAAVQPPGGGSIDFSVLTSQPTHLSINSPLTVSSVTSSQTGEVGAGAIVRLTLTMNETAVVATTGGLPTLELNDGGVAAYDAAASNPSSGKLVFDYTVGADDATPNLGVVSVVVPSGSTITNGAGYNANFAAADDDATGLQVGPAFLSSITPSVTGDATTGQVVLLTCKLSQAVSVSGGTPTLSLSDGAIATYDSAASSPSTGVLTFAYTVGAGDYATNLEIVGYQSNGATVTDARGIPANLSGATDDALSLDINAAMLKGVTASPSSGEVGVGHAVKLTLTMNEAVSVNLSGGSPTLSLNDGAAASYDLAASDPATGSLTFDYTTGAGDQTPNLQVTQVNLNGSTIDDAWGHAADLSPASTFQTGLQVGAVFVSGVNSSLTGNIFTGQTDRIVLTMSGAVTLNSGGGLPTLSLSDGATATYDATASNPANDTLVFDYAVTSADYASDLTVSSYNANGASVTDANGVAADFSGVSRDDLYVDVNATIVTGVTASAVGEVGSGAAVAVTLTMSGPVVVDTTGGAPSLNLGDGWTATYDSAASAPAEGTLVFDYKVGATDETPNLSIIQAQLNGAKISDVNGHPVDISAASNSETGLQIGPAFVTQVTPSLTGNVTSGEIVQFDVAVSASATINIGGGSPKLSLSDGGVATYDPTSSSLSSGDLVFDYTVAAGDYSKDLSITGFAANGALIQDANGVAVDFSGVSAAALGLSVNESTRRLHDFNGDGVSDLVWQNTNGVVYEWLMANNQRAASEYLGNLSGWSLAAVGDFNDDSVSDMIWQNQSSGALYEWTMSNGVDVENTALGNLSGWKATAGDFNGDGTSDLVWESASDGSVWEWTMGSGQRTASTYLGNLSGWSEVGKGGDFNGDGTADLIWQNNTSGEVYLWEMSGGQRSSSVYFGNLAGWKEIATGDFNGDGISDLMWQNASGDVYEWEMNASGGRAASVFIGNLSGWSVEGTGDYSGGGTSDIVWENQTTGETYQWTMANGARANSTLLGSLKGWSGQ